MLVETSDGQPIKVYVYSALTDGVRELTLTPNSKWGGEGMYVFISLLFSS